jgi:murein DD-endopeptidase MepM/ murein hydrolase activator NlpD
MHKSKIIILCLSLTLFIFIRSAYADDTVVEDLKKQIEARNAEIENLNKEIKEIDAKLTDVGAEKKTLQNTIYSLDTTDKKLSTEVNLTENKINKTELTIDELEFEISAKEKKISQNRIAISKIIKQIQQTDSDTLLESYLRSKTFSEIWDSYESETRFSEALYNQVKALREYTEELSDKKLNHQQEIASLSDFKSELIDKKEIVEINKKEKNTLLSQTKSQEANYKKILDEKKKLADAFAKEIFDIESKIKIAIDPLSYPGPTKGLLSWPLDNVRITQYYGLTEYSRRLYSTGAHNGIDFGAAIGTPVKAVSSGVVEEVGNTDAKLSCSGRSYGKWVFIRHSNGLSSVYGHLSLIKAKAGDIVNAGDVIAYVGQSGYAFGAHLHLSLFASQGVNVNALTSATCGGMRIPMATPAAYLDPYPYF